MNTKEAIGWVKDAKNDLVVGKIYYQNEADKADGVIALLKRGETYEKMWEEL